MKKYTDVDIIAELQKLVDSHVDSYKEDFDIDKRIIRRAAESRRQDADVVLPSAWNALSQRKSGLYSGDAGSQHLPLLRGTDLRRVRCPRYCSEIR